MTAADVVTSIINFVALVFLASQVILAQKALRDTALAQREETARQRKQASIDMMVSTSQYRERLKAELPWHDRDPNIVAAFLNDANVQQLLPLREYLNHLEDLAVGVIQGVYDVDIVAILEGRRIIDAVNSYRPYIERTRVELDRPTIYQDILDLTDIMRAAVPEADKRRTANIADLNCELEHS